jgi:hypothetical protein
MTSSHIYSGTRLSLEFLVRISLVATDNAGLLDGSSIIVIIFMAESGICSVEGEGSIWGPTLKAGVQKEQWLF